MSAFEGGGEDLANEFVKAEGPIKMLRLIMENYKKDNRAEIVKVFSNIMAIISKYPSVRALKDERKGELY